MNEDVFKVPEVAQILHVSNTTVNRLLNSEKLKGYRPSENANWIIPRKNLIDYMKRQNIPLDLLETGTVKILVIDDENTITKSIKRVYQSDNKFEVDTAYSGFTAGAKMESFKPNVVILDKFFGDMDGRDFFKYIRSHDELSDIKVIGISGKMDEDEIQNLLDMGFDRFLQKPFSLSTLRKTVEELIL